MRSFAFVVALSLPMAALAAPPPKVDHVCAENEGKAVCPLGRVRMCAKDGALAACACPPGTVEKKNECAADPSPAIVSCVAPDATIGKALGLHLDFGSLEMPSLPLTEVVAARDTVAALDGKEASASDADLLKLAAAHESIEGAAAYDATSLSGAKQKVKLASRDHAANRVVAVRKVFVARFPSHPKLDEQKVALARALLRRAAYTVVGPEVANDRKLAWSLLASVIAPNLPSKPARDAAFVLGEQAVRDKDWPTVIVHEERVLKWAGTKLWADDHAFLAAAHARMAHARLEAGDLARAKLSLEEAITIGVSCSPRAECVSAASGARKVIGATWAATSSPARSLAPILQRGSMPKHERVRPLLLLSELYEKGSGAGCNVAAEEARAWQQVVGAAP